MRLPSSCVLLAAAALLGADRFAGASAAAPTRTRCGPVRCRRRRARAGRAVAAVGCHDDAVVVGARPASAGHPALALDVRLGAHLDDRCPRPPRSGRACAGCRSSPGLVTSSGVAAGDGSAWSSSRRDEPGRVGDGVEVDAAVGRSTVTRRMPPACSRSYSSSPRSARMGATSSWTRSTTALTVHLLALKRKAWAPPTPRDARRQLRTARLLADPRLQIRRLSRHPDHEPRRVCSASRSVAPRPHRGRGCRARPRRRAGRRRRRRRHRTVTPGWPGAGPRRRRPPAAHGTRANPVAAASAASSTVGGVDGPRSRRAVAAASRSPWMVLEQAGHARGHRLDGAP